ncbi:hypothetical protein AB0K15_45550 [Amycolatopsis sp. NPDC049253]|uniref:hypothetical protein n=1 Tax=Amycolatopsis sp. NPDC049253 TaxID=3155274 RepID=UPI00344858EB
MTEGIVYRYPAGLVDWAVSVDFTIARAHQHATTITVRQRAGWNYTDLLNEPPDQAIGRSRGGWSTKVHHLVDGNGRPLVALVGPGQAGNAPTFPHLMRHLAIRRTGRGRARTRRSSCAP